MRTSLSVSGRLATALALLLLSATTVRARDLSREAASVVKLFITQQPWDIAQPWTKQPAVNATCSGFFIRQGILTNAHCAQDATFIEVEVTGMPDKFEGEVVAVNHQVDLALVRVKDPSRLRKIRSIELGNLPEHREKVVTVGFPRGGRQISFTEGVVSRIDILPYAHSQLPGLLVQTDAALNPGNSGGPVFSDASGDCLGVATQGDRSGEGLGYFVPTPVVRQFLQDVTDGRVDGVANLGITYQTLENGALRDYLGLKNGQTGVRVRQTANTSSADGFLIPDDVIVEVERTQVFNDGQIAFREDSKIGFGYKLVTKQIGELLHLKIVRDGKLIDLSLPLKPARFAVIPRVPAHDEQPRYVVYGGLLFMAVEPRYLERWKWYDLPVSLKVYQELPLGYEGLDELVIIAKVLDAGINKGYGGGVENTRVTEVGGRKVARLADVRDALKAADGKGHLEVVLENGTKLVLDEAQVKEADSLIRQRYNIRE